MRYIHVKFIQLASKLLFRNLIKMSKKGIIDPFTADVEKEI